MTNVTGMPDMIACVRGTFVGIEVKDDKNGPYHVTLSQKVRLRTIWKCGGAVAVVDKNNVDDFYSFLDNIQNGEIRSMMFGITPEELFPDG